MIDKQLHLLGLCLYIIKGWRNNSINIIWELEEPVCKSISAYNSIIQGSENITIDSMNNICLPPKTKYESMHWDFSHCHRINCVFLLVMQLKILAKFIKPGIFQEITKWVLWLKSAYHRRIIVILITWIVVRES